jgi:peptide/nickel transport system permease protein
VLIKFQNPDLGLSPAQIAECASPTGRQPAVEQYFHTLLAMLHGILAIRCRRVLRSAADCQQPAGYLSLALPAFILAVALALPSAFASRCRGCAG